MLTRKVSTYIAQNALLPDESKVVVGLSGGLDSVVLLHVLHRLGYRCIAAHCNFKLRDAESDRDELFVNHYCQELNIPLRTITFDTKDYAAQNKISIEMAARELRYEWFNTLLKQENASAIAVAHHADDSIETLLLNLVRGTGLKGLTGIAVRNGKVIRPLLCSSRNELMDYAMQYGLDYVEDSTNAENDFKRNKIRNLVLPLLEEVNPSVRQTLYKSVERFEGTLKIYDHAMAAIRRELVEKQQEVTAISIEKLLKTADACTVLYELLEEYGFTASTVKDISENLHDVSGKQFFSPAFRLVKDRDRLLITPLHSGTEQEIIIDSLDAIALVSAKIKIEKLPVEAMGQIPDGKTAAVFDAASLRFPLRIRKWEKGDTFVPFGMKTQKKLSDFFIDNKLSLPEKEKVRILESDGKIAWIMGYRTDDRFRVTAQTKEIIKISL